MTDFPEVSVLVVFRNEEKHLLSCIRSVIKQFEEGDSWELILVDGMSDDNSRKIIDDELRELAVNWKIIDNPGKTLARGWNLGIKSAKGKYVIRPDGHAALRPGYIKKAIEILKCHPNAAAAGGMLLTKADGKAGNIIRQALTSKTGVGNSSFRTGAPAGPSDTVVYGLYRKGVFDQVGYFNETLIRHQDTEMHYRIRQQGFELRYSPEIVAEYYCRDSFKALFRQMYLIGRHLPDLVKVGLPGALQLRHLAPLGFYLGICFLFIAGICFAPAIWAGTLLLGIYLTLIFLEAGVNAIKQKNPTLLLVALLIPVMHICYAFGTLRGLLSLPFSK